MAVLLSLLTLAGLLWLARRRIIGAYRVWRYYPQWRKGDIDAEIQRILSDG